MGGNPDTQDQAPNHLHMSLLGRRVLGNLRLSYTFWAPKESASVCAGLKNPSQGPWEPGALRAELCLGGQGTAEGALLLPFASL